MALVDEISYNLSLGNTVVLDGLGRFHLTVESDPVENKEDFDIKKNVKGVKCKFFTSKPSRPLKLAKAHKTLRRAYKLCGLTLKDEEE